MRLPPQISQFFVPNIDDIPIPCEIMVGDEIDCPDFKRFVELSKHLKCKFAHVELAFGGFPEATDDLSPITGKPDAKWELFFRRQIARMHFQAEFRQADKKHVNELRDYSDNLRRAAKSFEKTISLYKIVLGGRGHLFETQMMNGSEVGEEIRHGEISDLEIVCGQLKMMAKNSTRVDARLPKFRGGRNLQAKLLAEKTAILYRFLKRDITVGTNHLGDPSTPFSQTVKVVLGLFDCGLNWDALAREARDAMGTRRKQN